jgi:DNA-binding MarR family transcriptional regulator
MEVAQMVALLHVSKFKSVIMSEIAAAGGVSPSAITGTVDALEDRGWVVRMAGDDRRKVHVTITKAGEVAIREMFKEPLESEIEKLHEEFSR